MLKKLSPKIISLVSVLMMLVGSMAPVSAANTALPDSSQKGSITVHKYQVEQDELTGLPDATGVELDKNDPAISSRTPIENISFKITKVEAKNDNTPLSVSDYKVDSTFTEKTQATDANGETKFSDLPIGYYLVQEIDHPLVTVKCDDFIVAVPMTNPVKGNDFMYDIHVYPKNVLGAEPTISLSVTKLGNIHETIGLLGTEENGAIRNATMIATAEVPADIDIAEKFVMSVQWDDQLSYLSDSIVVKAYPNADRNESESVVLNKNSDYYVTNGTPSHQGGGSSSFAAVSGKYIGIKMDDSGKSKLAALVDNNGVAGNAVIDFSFEVSAKESIALGEAVVQTANLEYTSSINVSNTYTSNDVELHTGGFTLKNIDAENGNAVAGVEFKIYNSEADAKAGVNAIQNTNGSDLIGISDANGNIEFVGLPYGTTGDAHDSDAVRSYWVVQVQAVEYENGKYYELQRSAFEVQVSRSTHQVVNAIEIAHKKPFTLPNTGLTGVSLIGIGFVAMIASGTCLVAKKKKQA